MGLVFAILLCAAGIGIFAHVNTQGSKSGLIWGSIQFVLSSVGSVVSAIAKPFIFPEQFVPAQGIFEKKLTAGGMIISWTIDKIITYGPLVAVTILLFCFVCTAAAGNPRRGRQARNVDWRAKLR